MNPMQTLVPIQPMCDACQDGEPCAACRALAAKLHAVAYHIRCRQPDHAIVACESLLADLRRLRDTRPPKRGAN